MGEDEGWSEIGVVASEKVQRVAGSGDGIDCSDVRVLPVLGCSRAARVQSADERAAMLGRRQCAGLGTGVAAARVDTAELDMREAVGSGTFATVHRGVYRGQQVAVKVFNDKASPESLARELALSCALVHPNIVRCVGVGWQPAPSRVDALSQQDQQGQEQEQQSHEDAALLWKPVLVMEFCLLGSLFQMLYPVAPESKTRRAATVSAAPLDPHAHTIARGVAAALAHLHALGYAHFDLCSSNVLVCITVTNNNSLFLCHAPMHSHTHACTQLTGEFVPKLADFGQARRGFGVGFCAVGHEVYRAPELCAVPTRNYGRCAHWSERADVYSYGVLLWELLCKQLPFSDCHTDDVARLVRAGQRPAFPPAARVARPWRRLVRRCWAADPHARPAMAAVVAAVDALGTPFHRAPAPSPPRRRQRPVDSIGGGGGTGRDAYF